MIYRQFKTFNPHGTPGGRENGSATCVCLGDKLPGRFHCSFAICVLWIGMFMACFQARTVVGQDYGAMIERCEPYREKVETILRSEGVSQEYYYLMVAESRCTINAKSKAGARGFWQLMPSTAKHYGCLHPDEVECATKAAAKYVKHLQKSFKSFNEVIKAYNMGGHNYRLHGATNDAKGLVFLVNRLIREADKLADNDDVEIIEDDDVQVTESDDVQVTEDDDEIWVPVE